MNNSKKDHLLKIFFIIIFLGFLFLPCIQQITGIFHYDGLNEKRKKAEFPQFSFQNSINNQYFSEINKYYEDNFGFRDLLIQTNNSLHLKLFQKLLTDDLIVGKDNWLFYYITLDDYQKKSLHPKEIGKAVTKLEAFSDNLRSHGIDFYLIISPNKNTIYPEYMPDNISKPKEGSQSNLELFAKELQKNQKVKYLELQSFLLEEKNEYQVYPKNDSHWTYTGAHLVANNILSSIYEQKSLTFYPSTIDFDKYRLYDQFTEGNKGDLQNLLGTFGAKNIADMKDKLPAPNFPSSYDKLPKTIWYQTSFSDKLKSFMDPYFTKIIYHHYQEEPMSETLPDNLEGTEIVVFEIVERWLYSLVSYEYPKI